MGVTRNSVGLAVVAAPLLVAGLVAAPTSPLLSARADASRLVSVQTAPADAMCAWPSGSIEGQKSLLGRTMHDLAYDSTGGTDLIVALVR